MKNLILIALLILGINFANAQDSLDWRFKSVSIVTGETSLTSGNTFSAVLSKSKSVIIVDYNATLGEIIYLYSPKDWFSVGFSGGEVKNTPWFGPIVTLSILGGHIKTLHWPGWSFGDPEKWETTGKVDFCFFYNQMSLSYKNFEGYYANLIYQRNRAEHIFGLKKDFAMSKNISMVFGGGYMLNARKYLWSTGLCYNFKTN